MKLPTMCHAIYVTRRNVVMCSSLYTSQNLAELVRIKEEIRLTAKFFANDLLTLIEKHALLKRRHTKIDFGCFSD